MSKGQAPDRFSASLSAPLPEHWIGKESITLLGPDGQCNVICSSEPVSFAMDTGRYAQIQGDILRREFPGFLEHSFESFVVFGDCDGLLRLFSWNPPDGVPVTQLQLYYAEHQRAFTATATSPSTTFGSYEADVRTIMAGLRRSPTPAGPEGRATGDWLVSKAPRPHPRVRDAVAVGEEQVRGADGGYGVVTSYATPSSYEECVAQLIGESGQPESITTEKASWRSEATADGNRVVTWVSAYRGSAAVAEPGFDHSRVPAGTAAVISYGRYEGPAGR